MLSISIIIKNIDRDGKIRIMNPMTAPQPQPPTISEAISRYLDMVKSSRSKHTLLAYKNAMQIFRRLLTEKWLDPETTSIARLSEDLLSPLIEYLHTYSTATEQLYLQAVKGFYLFVDAERLAEINQSRVQVLIHQRSRRPGIRFPQFPAEGIERLLAQVETPESLLSQTPADEDTEIVKLRAMRDRAFLITLADTGLRVHEACALRRGDVDWNEGRAVIIGKGDKQAVIRFTTRALRALKEYLALRAALDGSSGRQLSSLPLFARHDKGAGKKIKPITPTTGRNIVKERVKQFLGEDMVGRITPHSLRHYFVTSVLQGTGNLKIAQELARHKNIQVTQRYAHLSNDELDKAYYEVFEKRTKRT